VDAADLPALKKAGEHGPRREDGIFNVSHDRRAAAVPQQESLESFQLGRPDCQHQPCSGAGWEAEALLLPRTMRDSFVVCSKHAIRGGSQMAFCAVPSVVNSLAAVPNF